MLPSARGSDDLSVRVLLHESESVQDAISRAIGGVNAIFGIVVPAAFGVLLFTSDKEFSFLSPELRSVALSGIVSLAVLSASALWVEALQYLRYKYLVLLPRLYDLGGISGENFLQYQARTRPREALVPTILFQVLVFVLGGGLSIAGVFLGTSGPTRDATLYIGLALAPLALAFVGSVATWNLGVRITREIRESSPSGPSE